MFSVSRTVNKLLDHYVWELNAMGMARESQRGCSLSPGLHAAANCLPALINIDSDRPTMQDFGIHRSVDPGAGSMTVYGGAKSWASRFIPAGGELFLDYGDDWFLSRNMSHVALGDDLDLTKRLIVKLSFVTGNKTSPALQIDLWNLIRSVTDVSVVTAIFPDVLDEALGMAKDGTFGTISQVNATHSIEYLEYHGTCLDTIRPAISSIRGAGLGAFAARRFVNDEVVLTSIDSCCQSLSHEYVRQRMAAIRWTTHLKTLRACGIASTPGQLLLWSPSLNSIVVPVCIWRQLRESQPVFGRYKNPMDR